MIDLNQNKSMNELEIEILADKHQKVIVTEKELPKLDVGIPVLYKKNPDYTKIKCPKWAKGTVKDIKKSKKYHILTDIDKMVTRSRHYIKVYMTSSQRFSKAPKCLIEQ